VAVTAPIRRHYIVIFTRTEVLLKRLRASRLNNGHEAEMRKVIRVDLFVVDDLALQPLDHPLRCSFRHKGPVGSGPL